MGAIGNHSISSANFLRSVYLGDIDRVAEVPADKNGDLILSAYVIAEASYLVTGDKGILELSGDYTILTAAEFVEVL